jgi:hypothetical protein
VAEVTLVQQGDGKLDPQGGILTYDNVLATALQVSAARLQLMTRCFFHTAILMVCAEAPAMLFASLYFRGLPRSLLESDLVAMHWVNGNPATAATNTLKGLGESVWICVSFVSYKNVFSRSLMQTLKLT